MSKQVFFVQRFRQILEANITYNKKISEINWTKEAVSALTRMAGGAALAYGLNQFVKNIPVLGNASSDSGAAVVGGLGGLYLAYKQIDSANKIADMSKRITQFLELLVSRVEVLSHDFYRDWFLIIEMLGKKSILSLICVFNRILQEAGDITEEQLVRVRNEPEEVYVLFWDKFKEILVNHNENPNKIARYFGFSDNKLSTYRSNRSSDHLEWKLSELLFNAPVLVCEPSEQAENLMTFRVYLDHVNEKSSFAFFTARSYPAEGSHKYPCRVVHSEKVAISSTIGHSLFRESSDFVAIDSKWEESKPSFDEFRDKKVQSLETILRNLYRASRPVGRSVYRSNQQSPKPNLDEFKQLIEIFSTTGKYFCENKISFPENKICTYVFVENMNLVYRNFIAPYLGSFVAQKEISADQLKDLKCISTYTENYHRVEDSNSYDSTKRQRERRVEKAFTEKWDEFQAYDRSDIIFGINERAF